MWTSFNNGRFAGLLVAAAVAAAVLGVGWGSTAMAYDKDRCTSANSQAASTQSAYSSAKTAYDYCRHYGDTSGTGYGSTDCNGAYSKMQAAQSDYDDAVSAQWQYCY